MWVLPCSGLCLENQTPWWTTHFACKSQMQCCFTTPVPVSYPCRPPAENSQIKPSHKKRRWTVWLHITKLLGYNGGFYSIITHFHSRADGTRLWQRWLPHLAISFRQWQMDTRWMCRELGQTYLWFFKVLRISSQGSGEYYHSPPHLSSLSVVCIWIERHREKEKEGREERRRKRERRRQTVTLQHL